MFWLLLTSACTASRPSLSSSAPLPANRLRWARRWERTQSNGYSIPYNVMLSNKNGRRRGGWAFWLPKWLLFGDWLGIGLPVGGGEVLPLLRLFFPPSFLHIPNCIYLDP